MRSRAPRYPPRMCRALRRRRDAANRTKTMTTPRSIFPRSARLRAPARARRLRLEGARARRRSSPADDAHDAVARSTQGMSPAMADAAQRALQPGLPDRSGEGEDLQGHRRAREGPAARRRHAARPGGPARSRRRRRPQFRGRRPPRGDPQHPRRHPQRQLHIDATVGGTVTLRTSSGIPREALPATLEMLLRMNGAAMVKEDGIYKIVRRRRTSSAATSTPQLGNSQRALPPGFSVQIVPLRYVGVREMMRILEPFAKDAARRAPGRPAQPDHPVGHRAASCAT